MTRAHPAQLRGLPVAVRKLLIAIVATVLVAAPFAPARAQTFGLTPAAPSAAVLAETTADAVAATTQWPATLPHDLPPLGMFLAADIVVKAVMTGLAAASFAVWTVWLAKSMELWGAKRNLRRALAEIAERGSVADAVNALTRQRGAAALLLAAAQAELNLSRDLSDKTGIKERVASRLAGVEQSAGRAIRSGTGLLATVGATAPFLGLFGTVWGIMNSFIGISKAQTTNLAVVAPGIAEALLATAIGLIAAIPAVILYNQLTRSVAGYRALLQAAAAEVERLVSRELDRAEEQHGRRQRAALRGS